MIPHNPPEIQPLILFMIVFDCLPRPGFVETDTLFQVSTAGASAGETAAKTPFSSMYSFWENPAIPTTSNSFVLMEIFSPVLPS